MASFWQRVLLLGLAITVLVHAGNDGKLLSSYAV